MAFRLNPSSRYSPAGVQWPGKNGGTELGRIVKSRYDKMVGLVEAMLTLHEQSPAGFDTPSREGYTYTCLNCLAQTREYP